MAEVGPIPLSLFDDLNLASDAVPRTLLPSGNRLVIHRQHLQPDSLRNLDGGRSIQFDGLKKQNAHAAVRHVDYLPHDQAVRATHLAGRGDLASWIQPLEALLFRHCGPRLADRLSAFERNFIYPASGTKAIG